MFITYSGAATLSKQSTISLHISSNQLDSPQSHDHNHYAILHRLHNLLQTLTYNPFVTMAIIILLLR